MSRETPQDLKGVSEVSDLAEAVSTQVRVSNRSWILLMGVALIALVPHSAPTASATESFELPFGLGAANPAIFFPVIFAILAVLTIGFCVSHAQQVRASSMAQSVLEKLPKTRLGPGSIYPRDLYDMLRLPSVSRVAPLAQLFRDRYQFDPEARACPGWRRRVSAVYYSILKIVATTVYLILPALALIWTYVRAIAGTYLTILLTIIGVVAALALVQIAIHEILYIVRVTKLIWSKADGATSHAPTT